MNTTLLLLIYTPTFVNFRYSIIFDDNVVWRLAETPNAVAASDATISCSYGRTTCGCVNKATRYNQNWLITKCTLIVIGVGLYSHTCPLTNLIASGLLVRCARNARRPLLSCNRGCKDRKKNFCCFCIQGNGWCSSPSFKKHFRSIYT